MKQEVPIMNETAQKVTADIDYIAILNVLNWLVSTNRITAENAGKTASRIAEQLGVSLIII
jgi:hypothetical protein